MPPGRVRFSLEAAGELMIYEEGTNRITAGVRCTSWR